MQAGGNTGGNIVTRGDTVPANHLHYLIELGREAGVELTPRLPPALSQLSPEQEEILCDDFYQLIETLLSDTQLPGSLGPALGLRLGLKFSLVDYGVLGYACICAPTLGQSIRTFLHFQQLAGSDSSFYERMQVSGDSASIQVSSRHINEALNRFDSELSVGQWLGAGRTHLNGDDMFERVHFEFAKPDCADQIEALCRCPVAYEQDQTELFFAAEILERPLSMANSITAELCRQQCETLLQDLHNCGGLAEQVRRLIIHQPGAVPEPEQIAASLNMSYRSLRRRLSEEGTSFKDIHNQVRMGMAQEYLRATHLSTAEIAFLLGFSEVTNFHRAFKNWCGQTPGEYRSA